MIVQLDRDIFDLKIGILGTRSKCFTDILDKHQISYYLVSSIEDIDETYDIIFESGVYSIIPEEVLIKPTYGFIGIHETPLPEGKGWAPIQWTVLNKRKHLTITLYKLASRADNGKIINQVNKPIFTYDTLYTLNKKREEGISECFEIFIEEMKSGFIVLREQSGKPSYHKKRTKENSELNPDIPLKDLWDEIRICDNENYPAFFVIGDTKIILRYEVQKK